MILPIPKSHDSKTENCNVPSQITVSGKGELSNIGAEAFCLLFETATTVSENGFEVINSFYPYTYTDMDKFLNAEKLKTWSPINIPELPKEHIEKVVGGEMCV